MRLGRTLSHLSSSRAESLFLGFGSNLFDPPVRPTNPQSPGLIRPSHLRDLGH